MDLFGNLFYIIYNMKKYDLYLFDFDGTLLDTMPALEYVFTTSYKRIGVEFDPRDTAYFSRIPLEDGYEKIGADPQKYGEFCQHIIDTLDSDYSLHSNRFYPESEEFFKYLKEHNIKAGIVTSNRDVHVKEVLEIMGIPVDTFVVYIGRNQYEKPKPHPEPILTTLRHLGYQGPLNSVLYVGDGINDTISANEAGVNAVLIDRNEEFSDSDKYIRIKNLFELFE